MFGDAEVSVKSPTLAPVAPGGGNTKLPPPLPKKSEKRPNSSKFWTFTWNNYPENWMALLAPGFQGSRWIAGKEIGETGTPHLQGYVEFSSKVRPIGYKGMPKEIHWEKRCPNATAADNIKYCSKDGDTYGNIKPPRPLPEIELYGWQIEAEKKFRSAPDNRSIFWYWSEKGGVGKSAFCRWAVMNGALICSGKAADMKFIVAEHYKKTGNYPDVCIFDVPRSMRGYLSYTGMEEIKNGVFASTKYESAPVIMPYVHVFVFANFAPAMDDEDMSHDRYIVVKID